MLLRMIADEFDKFKSSNIVKKAIKEKTDSPEYAVTHERSYSIILHKNGFNITNTESTLLRRALKRVIDNKCPKENEILYINHNKIKYGVRYAGKTEFLYRFKLESVREE